jgi:23S rRNA pseudouridine1911/1915/1917 synthase
LLPSIDISLDQSTQDIVLHPYVVQAADDYTVIYKPPKMHTSINQNSRYNDVTLVKWYENNCEYNSEMNAYEYGLLHRLDYETRGLVIFAKTIESFYALHELQKNNLLIKNYTARCICNNVHAFKKGFPPAPDISFPKTPCIIESAFRAYGPHRKEVRPVVTNAEAAYKTTILNIQPDDDAYIFNIQITKGFRHQIRCHLAWAGYPIIGDPLYNNDGEAMLELCACGLQITDKE